MSEIADERGEPTEPPAGRCGFAGETCVSPGGVEIPRGIEAPAWRAGRVRRRAGHCRHARCKRDYSERRSAQGFAREARRPAWRPAAAMRSAVSAAGPR